MNYDNNIKRVYSIYSSTENLVSGELISDAPNSVNICDNFDEQTHICWLSSCLLLGII